MASSFSAFGIVWSIVFVLFFLIPGILRWIRQRREIQNQHRRAVLRSRHMSEQWDDFRWAMPLGSRLMAAQEQRHRSRQSATTLCRRRKDYIRETLILKKVVLQDHPVGVSSSKSLACSQRQKGDLVLYSSPQSTTPPQTDSELSEIASTGSDSNFSEDGNDDTHRISIPSEDNLNSEDDDGPTCTICFNPYEAGDEIYWSNNPKCNHFFHKDCLEEWLVRHDECPCCRLNYMTLPKEMEACNGTNNDEEEEEVEGRPISNSAARSSSTPRQRRRRVPPLSNEQSTALAEGNGDSMFSSSEEESLVSMLATIEQLYRQAQVRLYYAGTATPAGTSGDENDTAPEVGGPRIIALPMPQHPVFRQRPLDLRRSSSQVDVDSSDVEMGVLVVPEEGGEEERNAAQQDGIAEEGSTRSSVGNRMSA